MSDPWAALSAADRDTILRAMDAASTWLADGSDDGDRAEAAEYAALRARLGDVREAS